MRAIFVVLGAIISNAALAHTPGIGDHPQGLPVHGPIRPRADIVAVPIPSDPALYELVQGLNGAEVAPVLHTQVLFWGTRWADRKFAGDKIEGLNRFYSGYSGSDYSTLAGEYMTADGPVVPIPSVKYRGYVVDRSPVPQLSDDDTNFNAAVAEICNEIDSGRIRPLMNPKAINYFPVYVARRRPAGGSCGQHGYYQYTANGLCTTSRLSPGFTFTAGLFYDMDGDEQCDVHDHATGHSKGLAALANTSARAIAEVQTDPYFGGWYDSTGNEIDDKCAYSFSAPYVKFTNESIWKLQDLWSNIAYESGNGYVNIDGAAGCVYETSSGK